jgi:hypothetical protein
LLTMTLPAMERSLSNLSSSAGPTSVCVDGNRDKGKDSPARPNPTSVQLDRGEQVSTFLLFGDWTKFEYGRVGVSSDDGDAGIPRWVSRDRECYDGALVAGVGNCPS